MAARAAFAASGQDSIAFSANFAPREDQVFLRSAGNVVAGLTRREASTTLAGKPVSAELVLGIEYRDGSGPQSGFLTLTWERSDALALRYKGEAFRNADGSTTFDGTIEVLGGLGNYSRSTGRGVFHGFRSGGAGGTMVCTVHVDVERSAASAAPASEPLRGSVQSPPPAPAKGVELRLAGTPGQRFFREAGVFREVRYGGARRVGKATWDGVPVSVEWLGLGEYRDGDGPATGFVVFQAEDGSTLLGRHEGIASRAAGGTADVTGRVEVIAGTGRWANAKGSGAFAGTRGAEATAPLSLRLALDVAAR